jgi:hypothetical protein
MHALSARARPRLDGITPVPAGEALFESLRSSLVRFSRLLQSLEAEAHTGYLSLVTDGGQGLVFFRDGRRTEAVYESDSVSRGKTALDAIAADVEAGTGVLDAVILPGVLVDVLPGLWLGKPLYKELRASWVDVNGLLGFLHQRGTRGSVLVRSATATGVILLLGGDDVWAYTSGRTEPVRGASIVADLCSDPQASIEVRSAALAPGEEDGIASLRLELSPLPEYPVPD